MLFPNKPPAPIRKRCRKHEVETSALLPDEPPVPPVVTWFVASLRPVGTQSQRLAAGEARGKRMHAADPVFADNHHPPCMARVVAGRLFEALGGEDFHGEEKFPLPCALLADGAVLLVDQPSQRQGDRADGGGAQSQGRKEIVRVEVKIELQGKNPAEYAGGEHKQGDIATRGASHGAFMIKGWNRYKWRNPRDEVRGTSAGLLTGKWS